jgi:lipid-A-disaccharide synthase
MLSPPRILDAAGTAAERLRPATSGELVIVANGPGELSGWAVPLAGAARAWAAAQDRSLTLSLVLTPCQVASGFEMAFARQQGVFDRIFPPKDCLAFVTGWRRFPSMGPGCVLHMGGDLWYSAMLARRFGFPAFAYVETMLIRGRSHQFERAFVPSPSLADRLIRSGFPAQRLTIVGDVRVEHVQKIRPGSHLALGRPRVALLPGSRDWILRMALPFLLELVTVVRARRPEVRFELLVSPFLPRGMINRAISPRGGPRDDIGIDIVDRDQLQAAAQCDLAVTYPGTNTVELAILGVPMLVVLPLDRPQAIHTPGLNEWLSRIPGMARLTKSIIVGVYMRRHKLLAWPNRDAGRLLTPEMVGRITPEQVARRTIEMLDDRPGLQRISRDLRALYPPVQGAAIRILEEMAPFLWTAAHHAARS